MTESGQGETTAAEHTLLHLQIRPGTAAEYRRRHDEIWPEMALAIRESGISALRIFLQGEAVTIYAVCHPDAQSAFARLAATDVNDRWDAHMADVLVDRQAATWSPEIWVLD